MKVLLVTSSYKNSWPFLPELREALLKERVTVHVLDVSNLILLNERGNIASNPLLAKLNTVRGGHRFIRYTANYFIRKTVGNYDAINIHNLEYLYLFLIDELKKHSKNVSVSLWGSDFYRASDVRIKSYLPLFEKLNFICFGNEYTKSDFDERIPGFGTKHKIAKFGIGKFDVLNSLLPNRDKIKSELGIPPDKITVVIGYNAYPAQQHFYLLRQISQLDDNIKKDIFLLLPLTYGGNKNYKAKIIKEVKKTGCNYKVFTHFTSDEYIAKLRVIGDIVLNAQISDSFSASLQEHILCNAVLIAGVWLPYQVMTDLGLMYCPVALDGFGKKLQEVVENYELYKEEVKNNNSKLYRIGTWGNRIEGWIDLYKANQ